jgi:hypothetical protein
MSQAGLARVTAGALPPAVPLQFTGDNGTIAVPAANNITIFANNATQNSGSSVRFTNAGSTSTLNLSDVRSNTLLGTGAGNATLTGTLNTSVGYTSLTVLTSGSRNTGIGYAVLNNCTTGTANTAIGYESLFFLTTGSSNTCLGDSAGSNYTTESSNICIRETGTTGDANTIRIGNQGSFLGAQNKCFIAGIIGVSVANTQLVTINSVTTQLGVTSIAAMGGVVSLTGNDAVIVNPSGGNINVLGLSGSKTSGSGATLTVKSPPFSQVGASATSSLNTGEFVTAAVTRTLPASAGLADGDLFIYICTTAGALVIQSVSAQKIRIGNQISSAAGTATSTAIGDSISLRFNATDGFFYTVSIQGNWTLA